MILDIKELIIINFKQKNSRMRSLKQCGGSFLAHLSCILTMLTPHVSIRLSPHGGGVSV